MDAVSEVADAMGALGVDNGASQKFLPKDSPDSEELADVALSGESEVINPSEEVGGEATSPSEDIKSQPEGIKARVPKVRACHVDTLSLLRSHIDGLVIILCFLPFSSVLGKPKPFP